MTPVARSLLAAGAIGMGLSGCGSPSHNATRAAATATPRAVASASPAPAPKRVGGVSVRGLEHALLTRGGPPPPTAAICLGATSAERHAAPFWPTRRPLFSCVLTVVGETARYDVQVLRNGCFVAERARRSRAVLGCGVDRVAVAR